MSEEIEKIRLRDERSSEKLLVEPEVGDEKRKRGRSASCVESLSKQPLLTEVWFESCTHQANPASLNSKLNQILTVPSISSRNRHSPPSSGLMNSGSGWEMKPFSSLQSRPKQSSASETNRGRKGKEEEEDTSNSLNNLLVRILLNQLRSLLLDLLLERLGNLSVSDPVTPDVVVGLLRREREEGKKRKEAKKSASFDASLPLVLLRRRYFFPPLEPSQYNVKQHSHDSKQTS